MNKSNIKYSKLTFILSVIGFIGSLGFYFGVLRSIYKAPAATEKVELLQEENQQLKQQVKVLTQTINDCQEDK